MSTADESWYFTQNGERKGPVSLDLLNELVAKEKLNAESDLVWGPDLSDWTKAGELDALKPSFTALAEAKAAAEAAAQAAAEEVAEEPQVPVVPEPQVSPEPVVEEVAPVPPPPSVPVPTAVVEQQARKDDDDDLLAQAMEARREKREKTIGLSRGKFLGGSFGLHIIGFVILGIIYAQLFNKLGVDLNAAMSPEKMAELAENQEAQEAMISSTTITNVVTLLIGLVTFLMVLSRLQNLGMSRWNFLWNFVPFANIWINYRIIACPAGYAQHQKLDGSGKLLAVIYFLPFVFLILSIAGLVYAVTSGALGELPDAAPLLEQLQEMQKLKMGPETQL